MDKVINYPKIPIIKSKRLTLRPFKLSDAQMMFDNWACDEDVTRYLSWTPHQDVKETKKLIQSWIDKQKQNNGYYQWAIVLNQTNEVIGSITHFEDHEIGYCISKKYWNQSITSEALKGVLYFLFKYVKLESVFAVHNIENVASGKVMQKCKMVYDRQVTSTDNHNNPIECSLYTIKNPYLK